MTQHAETAVRETAVADTGWPAVIVTDAAGVVVHWSASATAMYGWPAAEALGTPVGDLILDPEDSEKAAEIVGVVAGGASWEGAFRVRHRDGATFAAHVLDVPLRDATGALVGIVGLSYPMGEARFPLLAAERAMRAAAARATERLRRLQQVTAELSRVMTTDEVARTVLTLGMQIEGAGSGAMWLLDEAKDALRLLGTGGDAPGMGNRFTSIPLDADLPGPYVVRSREALYLRSRADRDARWPALADVASAMEAQAIVPLVVDGAAIGCMSFGFPDERDVGEGERDFLAALSNVCAQVLDRARLYEAERAASRRVAFLAEASAVLNSSLDYHDTLERVVTLLLDAFAAQVVVDLVDAEGAVERVAMGHVDPAKRDVLERLRHSTHRPGSHGWEVLVSGRPKLVPELDDAHIRDVTTADEYAVVVAADLGPMMVVPLTAGGRVTGLLYVGRPRGAAAFTEEDLALAVDLASRAGSAVDNARLFAARTAVAETLQRGLLPPRLPAVPGVELGARYRAAYAGLDIGGDFYDCFPVDGEWAFMIGDVVGTGPAAAAVTAVVRHTARAVAPYVADPAAVTLAVRDALVARDEDEVFCTMLYGVIRTAADGVTLSVVGAGHPPPYVLRASGDVERVVTTGGLLGVLPPVGIDAVDVRLAPGDAFVAVTDGVLEARAADGSGGFFDDDRLQDVIVASTGRDADAIAGAIEEAVVAYAGGRTHDDVAVLVLRAT